MRTLALAAVLAASLAASGTGLAAERISTRIAFAIESQPLTTALKEFARQAHVQILRRDEDVSLDGLVAPEVDGQLSAEEALKRILSRTGLTYEFVNERTVRIARPVVPAGDQGGKAAFEKTAWIQMHRLLLADAQTAELSSSDTNSTESEDSPGSKHLEQVVITGTNLKTPNDSAAPVLSISRTEFERAGQTTLQEVFRDLPQNFGAVSMDGSIATNGTQLSNAAFEEPVTAVDLRGLGPQSTLVLLNGERRAGGLSGRVVDVSTIPLSAVERIDVMTGGSSAVYGSDAVAGVVNLILRRKFDGAESQVYYGAADHNPAKLDMAQTFGRQYDHSGFIATYEFQKDWPLDIARTDLIVSPSVAGNAPSRFYVTPDDKKHAVYFAGEYDPSERTELFWDALYTHKNDTHVADYNSSGIDVAGLILGTNKQSSASAGAKIGFGGSWNLRITGSYSRTQTTSRVEYEFNGTGSPSVRSPSARVTSGSAVLNGLLPAVFGRQFDTAIGIEAREEGNSAASAISGAPNISATRGVRSAFAEMRVPFLMPTTAEERQRLDLSLAGRYDHYSDFGSAFNPQAGLVWSPGFGVSFRGNYAEAFRAPELYALAQDVVAIVQRRPDPTALGGRTPVLTVTGGNPDLEPERAKIWTFGIDYVPAFLSKTTISTSYFNVKYRDRIDVSAQGLDPVFVLQLSPYQSLVNRTPDAATINSFLASSALFQNITGIAFGSCPRAGSCTTNGAELLAAYPTLALFDNRVNNLASEKASGVDLTLQSSPDLSVGIGSFGVNATYIIDHTRKVTPASTVSSLVDEVGKPVDFRARLFAGIGRGPFNATIYGNYVAAYKDSVATPPGSISSWTTFDVSFQLDGSKLQGGGMLSRTRATLGVSNLFDRDPPAFLENAQGLRYDSANANPIGRFTSLRVLMNW